MTIIFHAFYQKRPCFLVIFMKTRFIFIDFDSEPTTLLRVDSFKVNKNLSHFIQIKILSTNKVMPKMPV